MDVVLFAVNNFKDNREVASASNLNPVSSLNTARLEERIEVESAAYGEELRAAEQETRRLARSHYENFLVASVLLPARLRQPFYNLYAFCRTADDLADESATPQLALDRLAALQVNLDQTYQGQPPNPLFLALSSTIRQFDLSKCLFDDLLDAFRQDQRKSRYSDFDELLDYCRRSANPVGRLVLQLGDCCDSQNGLLSDEICTGLQLANFWQDVARDYQIGRIYLPLDQMERFGVDESMVGRSATSPQLRQLLASECDRAEQYFRRGLLLAKTVPGWLAGDVKLFAHGGLETLAAIRKIDFDVLSRRPTVSKWRQSWLLVRAMTRIL